MYNNSITTYTAIHNRTNSSKRSHRLQNPENTVADQSLRPRDATQENHASEPEDQEESREPPVPQTKVIPLMLGATITTTPFSTEEHPVHPEVVASSQTDNEMAKADTPPVLRYLHKFGIVLLTMDPINLLLMHVVPGAKEICGWLAMGTGLATTGSTILLMSLYAWRLKLKGVRPSTFILCCFCLYLIPGFVCPAIHLRLRVIEPGVFNPTRLVIVSIVLLISPAIAFIVGLIHLCCRLRESTDYPTTHYTLVKRSFELLTIHMAYEL